MVFELSSEQQDFQNSVRRFFEKECDASYVRQTIEVRAKVEDAFQKSFNALGLSEVFSDAESAKQSYAELLTFATECGRSLCPLHVLETLVAGQLFFSTFLTESSRAEIAKTFGEQSVANVLSGKERVVRSPTFYRASRALEFNTIKEKCIVSGEIRLAPSTKNCRFLLHQQGEEFYLIALDEGAHVKITSESTLDITHSRSAITLTGAQFLKLEVADSAIYRALSYGIIAAEVLGACRKSFELTSEYLKTRRQFGVPVGSFQAVQHALSDMFLKIEMIDSLVSFLAWTLVHSPAQRELTAQAAIRLVVRDSIGVIEKAIQLHGGIGFTWEHDLHLYLRRVRSLCALTGDLSSENEVLLAQLVSNGAHS